MSRDIQPLDGDVMSYYYLYYILCFISHILRYFYDRSQPTKCSMENFHILKFLKITQNEIGRKENVEKKQRVFRGNNINLRKLRSLIPKVRSGRIFLPPQFL